MRIATIRVLLLSSLGVASLQGLTAQTSQHAAQHPIPFDLAVTYNAEYARVAPNTCNCFWMQGAAGELSATLWKGWGLSAQIGFNELSNYAPNLSLKKYDVLAGPRFVYPVKAFKGAHTRSLELFGEGLIGTAHAFRGAFPSPTGLQQSATSFALATGGGADWSLRKTLQWRVVQADYVRTTMPNNYSNTQNNLRLASGLVFHF